MLVRLALSLLFTITATHALVCDDEITVCADTAQFCCCDVTCTCCNNPDEFCFRGACAALPSPSATVSQSASTSASASVSPSTSATITSSASASRTTTTSPSASLSGSPTPSVSLSKSTGASDSPSAAPTVSPTASASTSASASTTDSPTSTSTATPTPTATATPSASLPALSPSAFACSAGTAAVPLELLGCAADGVTPVLAAPNASIERVVPVTQPLIVTGALELGAQSSVNFYARNATLQVQGTLTLSGGRIALRVDEPPPADGSEVVWQLFSSDSSLQGNYSTLDVVATYDAEPCTRLRHRERRSERSFAVVLTSETHDDGSDECGGSSSSSSSTTPELWKIIVPVVVVACAALFIVAVIGALAYSARRGWLWRMRNYEKPEDAAIRRAHPSRAESAASTSF